MTRRKYPTYNLGMPVNDIFGAVANPVRRRILELLLEESLAAGEIASRFELNRPAVSEHLQVLRNVGIVSEKVQGRQRIYHLNANSLQQIKEWLAPFEHYWQQRLIALNAALSEEEK